MPARPCPTDDRLRAFDRGDVPEDELDAIAAHLGGCAGCVARMARLAVPIGGLSLSSASASVPTDSAYRRAVERIAENPGVPRPPLPAVGDTLRDYRLTQVVGRGGMGVVFRAVHAKLDKVVAVKVLSGKRWHDPTAVSRFEREMRAVGRLGHPNIVQATDAGDAAGVPFLVMEFVDGQNLAALVKRDGPRSLAEAGELVRQAAAGLLHAHQAGVIHRDVKPSNLMLAADGTVKVLDLGLALPLADPLPADALASGSRDTVIGSTSDLTSASHTIGTLDYMAPEQKRDAHTVGPQADVYGLGGTLWYLLTGTPPKPPAAIAPAALPGGLSVAFWEKFLAFDPADRHADMGEVAAALAAVARPPAKPRKRRRVGAAVAVAVVLVVVGGIWMSRSGTTSPTESPRVDPDQAGVKPRPAPEPGKNPMAVAEAHALQQAWADHLGQKVAETGPGQVKTVLIPPGTFEMFPRYHVTVTKPFRLGATEVTRGQFTAFVAATGYKTTGELANPFRPFGAVIGPKDDSGSWRKPGYAAGDDHPITHVSHADALAYCGWLSKAEGKTYRLPTEAEWRWACRAGAATRYPFGDDPKPLREYAHYKATSDGRPVQVGVRRPNAWGLFDMLGNVKEWAQDGNAPTREGAFADPVVGPQDDGMRVACGGGYDGRTDVPDTHGWSGGTCDCNTRSGHHWYVAQPSVGFRVVRKP